MFCAKCGAVNAEDAPFCGKCGAPLEKQLDFPQITNQAGLPLANAFPGMSQRQAQQTFAAPEASLFAPIAHSPFDAEPLPQPSDALPTLMQPVGDIMVFAPTSAMPASPQPRQALPVQSELQPYDGEAWLVNSAQRSSRDLADYPTEIRLPVPMTPPTLPNSLPLVMPTAGQDADYNIYVGAPPSAGFGAWQGNIPDQHWQGGPGNLPYQQSFDGGPLQAPPVSQTLGNVYPGPSDLQVLGMSRASADVFIQPLPRWTLLAGGGALVLLLVGLIFLNPDWATGATVAGMIALICAILVLIAGGVRVALGLLAETNPHRRSQVISTGLLVLLLFLVCGVSLSQQSSLHAAQARYLEGQHSWSTAIQEYQGAGEAAPSSENLARTYNEWGEALSHQQQYASAISKFAIVLKQFTPLTSEVSRARSDTITTYLAWAAASSQRQQYANATTEYNALLALAYCTTSCQTLAQPKDATAYEQLAEQQLTAHQFAQAVAAFNVLTTRFASSSAAKAAQVHPDYAQALWGLGQQQLNTTCTKAVPTYQQLANQFNDTSQGKQATTALQQPVQVKGHFTQSVPGAPAHPTAFLVQNLTGNIQQYQFPPLLKSAPTTQINSDGSFTFSSVPQGTYELIWSNDGTLHFFYAHNNSQVLYTAQVGPLCTYDFGAVNQAIPPLSSGN